MRVWCKVPRYSLLALAFFVFGCNRTTIESSSSQNASSSPAANEALIIQPSQSPTDGDSREPELNSTQDGRIILSWVEKIDAKRYALRTSMRDANGWSEARTVAQGEDWFVNWADFPSVIALQDGSLAAHWLVKSGTSTYAYNVHIARSKDGGQTWTKPLVPHLDNTQTEHGFVSLIPLGDTRLGVVWLDGRNMKNMKEEEGEHTPSSETMTLRYAAIDADGKLADEAQLDERVCECCQTSAALTSDGVMAVYRDRSETEVRDIYSVRQKHGTWGTPQPVHMDNWKINGCPVNGPSIATDGQRVAVAWFTEVAQAPRVKIAFSSDSGATFAAPIEVDEGNAVGRVDTLLLPDGSALVCWMTGTVESGSIKVRRIQPDGLLGLSSVITQTDISRSSGFPRMARLGDVVHFAWTEFGKPSRVRMATTNIRRYR